MDIFYLEDAIQLGGPKTTVDLNATGATYTLLQLSRETVKFSTPELEEKIEYYKVLNNSFKID